MTEKNPKRAEDKKKKQVGEPDAAGIISVVIGVILILFILWFLANQFINMSSRRSGNKALPTATEQASSGEETGQSQAASTSSAPAPDKAASESAVKPLTDGEGDNTKPDTWVGKKFQIVKRANMREGVGTASSVLGSAIPGETIFVKEAQMEGDAVWVHGTIQKSDGGQVDAWLYSYVLSNTPQE